MTSLVVPQSGFNNVTAAKTLTFVEPSTPSAIAIKGYERNEFASAGLQLICQSTRPNSPWNFVSDPNDDWTSVLSLSRFQDTFPTGWFTNYFAGSQVAVTPHTGGFEMVPSSCGVPDPTKKIRINTLNRFHTFRKFINQTTDCGTNSPTSGTLTPSVSPSLGPTKLPSLAVSMSPTPSPSVLATQAPSGLPLAATTSPTLSPSGCHGVVQCCVSFLLDDPT